MEKDTVILSIERYHELVKAEESLEQERQKIDDRIHEFKKQSVYVERFSWYDHYTTGFYGEKEFLEKALRACNKEKDINKALDAKVDELLLELSAIKEMSYWELFKWKKNGNKETNSR